MLLKIDFVEVSRTCCDMYISKSVSVYRESFKEKFKEFLRSCCASCVPNLVKWLSAEVAECRIRRVCVT